MKAYTKDVIKTILKGMKRFLALALIAALGVCMMSGLKASCDDLRYTADAFFDKQNLFDIMVVSTYGLTDEDVESLGQIEGIEAVEGAYSETVHVQIDGQTKQVAMKVLSEKGINEPYVLDGELPMRADEIVVTQKFIHQTGYQIGDTIQIEETFDDEDEEAEADTDTEEEDTDEESIFDLHLATKYEKDESESEDVDEDDYEVEVEEDEEEPNFVVTEYTIVGVVIDSEDINSAEGAVAFRNNSTTDYTFFVLPQAVSTDIYTAVYLTLEGTDELQCYFDEYVARVEKIVSVLEDEIKAEREKVRYNEIINEAYEKVDEAEAEMNEKLSDAETEILDAKTELEDGWSQLLDGEDDILTGEEELAAAERQLEAAERELNSAERQMASAKSELEAGWSELETAEMMLNMMGMLLEEEETETEETQTGEDSTLDEFLGDITGEISGSSEVSNLRAEYDAYKKQLADARAQLEEAQAEYDAARAELDKGWVQLDEGWAELEVAYEEYYDGLREYESGKAELEDGILEYEDGVSEFEDKKAEALDKIADARQEIADLKMTEWYVSTRTALGGYSNIKTDAECIEAIGNAFPILFLTVAILISLTTISRMVEEDRGLIGTYKALGFTDREIRRKYVVYALLACIVGGILGLILGFIILPEIIFTVFGVMYQLPNYLLTFNWLYGIGGIVLFVAAIVGAAMISCSSELSNMPAMLMRPKAPKNGSRVLLERVTPVWSRLSFLNKVTARNLFRYKKRLFMTLFGIAGCTAILLVGFTIKDTVTNLMPLQYETTYTYDVMVVSDDNDQLLEYLDSTDVRAYINPMITNVKVINEDGREESVQLIVVPNEQSLRGYINLFDRDGNKITLQDGMVVSTINVAEVQGYDAGDSITIQNMNLENAEVEVTEIVMNYLGNSIYMTENTYSGLYDNYEANGAFVLLNNSVSDHEAYTDELSIKDGILSAICIAGFMSNFDNVFRIINLVVTIVIVLAAALAFVVLFTLSTTNISERERELATIKVLGFFDREVHAYVNKETLILTGLGILLGMPLGKIGGVWIMSILKMPSIYFADYLAPISYLYAGVIAITFAFIVNKITDKSLDKIDPVEALKSIE